MRTYKYKKDANLNERLERLNRIIVLCEMDCKNHSESDYRKRKLIFFLKEKWMLKQEIESNKKVETIETQLESFFNEIKNDTYNYYTNIKNDSNKNSYSNKDKRIAKNNGLNFEVTISNIVDNMKKEFINKIENKLNDKIKKADLFITNGKINGTINDTLNIKTFVAGGDVQCYHLRTKITLLK